MRQLIDATRSVGRALDHILTTKWPAWLDELKRKQDAEFDATNHRRSELTSEGWAAVMVLLGVALGILLAYRNGLI